MPRRIAFLRAINVGGHNVVTMAALRGHFEALGFEQVETFINSGNVIFKSKATSDAALERKIEAHLEKSLGCEVKRSSAARRRLRPSRATNRSQKRA
jgi:uncharacterized protein (DUF1697 family)